MDMRRDVQSGVVFIQEIVGNIAHCYATDDTTKASFTLEMNAQELLEIGLKSGDRFRLQITTEITPLPPVELTLEQIEEIEKKLDLHLAYDDLLNDY